MATSRGMSPVSLWWKNSENGLAGNMRQVISEHMVDEFIDAYTHQSVLISSDLYGHGRQIC